MHKSTGIDLAEVAFSMDRLKTRLGPLRRLHQWQSQEIRVEHGCKPCRSYCSPLYFSTTAKREPPSGDAIARKPQAESRWLTVVMAPSDDARVCAGLVEAAPALTYQHPNAGQQAVSYRVRTQNTRGHVGSALLKSTSVFPICTQR